MGEFICVAVPVVFVVGLVALTVRSAVIGWKLRERWGCVHALREAGTGAYRAGAITESRLRGVPWTVMVTGVTGTALSLLTGFVLAPSGFVGALLLRDHDVLVAFTEYNRNVIRLEPPLICDEGHVDQFCDALDALLGRGIVSIVKDFIRSQMS